jgi:cyclic pyranopterin phosphate synthase
MTGVRGPDRVIEGIQAAKDAGLQPIRLNTVVLSGENEAELPDLVRFAADHKLEIRFIELMPMGPLADQWADRYVPEAAMRGQIDPIVRHWSPIEQGHGSARRFEVSLHDGRHATIGFITPMSCNFCAACNRLRLTSDGDVYPCLMDQPRGNIMSALTPRFDAQVFDQTLIDALQDKASEHPVNGFTIMTVLGG